MITYRLATAPDATQIVSLLGEIMHHHGVAPPAPLHLEATVSTILGSQDHLILVAETTGRLVGMCALLFSQSTWSASPVCELQDVLVTRSSRRADIGRGLIEAAEQIAYARGCTRLFLLAEYWNLDAHAFYRSLGLAEKTCLYFERDLRRPLL
ncbi:MAG: GNAT family N-acetyltransferase [Actinobacteria bacterium]|nr:GNAT family N-acetyltransferase [Actinomycetota bacterium]